MQILFSFFVYFGTFIFVDHFHSWAMILCGEPLFCAGDPASGSMQSRLPLFFFSGPGHLVACAPVDYPRRLCAKQRASSQKHVTCGIFDPSVDICLLRAQFSWGFELASHCLQWVSGEEFSVFQIFFLPFIHGGVTVLMQALKGRHFRCLKRFQSTTRLDT